MKLFKNKQNGRTVSSTKQSPVFSYYNNRPTDIASARPVPRKKLFQSSNKTARAKASHHLLRLPSYVAMALIAASLLYATSLSTDAKVLVGSTKGDDGLLRTTAVYDAAVTKVLESSIFNRSKLTINTVSTAAAIQRQFPEIQQATISIPLVGRKPVVGLEPAQPAAIISSGSSRYIIGDDGRALANTSGSPPSTLRRLVTIEDKSNVRIEQGKAVLPKDNVTFITTFIKQLARQNVKVASMELPQIANELHIRIEGKKYYIKCSLNDDARLQAGTFLAVKERLEKQSVNPAEYIDVRIAGRAYYK
jgi:hypothetical protein